MAHAALPSPKGQHALPLCCTRLDTAGAFTSSHSYLCLTSLLGQRVDFSVVRPAPRVGHPRRRCEQAAGRLQPTVRGRYRLRRQGRGRRHWRHHRRGRHQCGARRKARRRLDRARAPILPRPSQRRRRHNVRPDGPKPGVEQHSQRRRQVLVMHRALSDDGGPRVLV